MPDDVQVWADVLRRLIRCLRLDWDPADFMSLGSIEGPRGIEVHVFKHIHTRQLLSIDEVGHQFEIEAAGGSEGRDVGEEARNRRPRHYSRAAIPEQAE